MEEHELLYEELNCIEVKNQVAMDLSDKRYDTTSFTAEISTPFITAESFDTPLELMATLKKYISGKGEYQKLMKILVVAAMKYRSAAPKEDKISERVYNF